MRVSFRNCSPPLEQPTRKRGNDLAEFHLRLRAISLVRIILIQTFVGET